MKKRILICILSLICAFGTAFSFSACNLFDSGNDTAGKENSTDDTNNGGSGNTGSGSGNTDNGSGNTGSGSGNTGSGSGNTGSGSGNTGSGSGNTGSGSGNTGSGSGNTGSGSGNTGSGTTTPHKHSYEWVIQPKPTKTVIGEANGSCKYCDETKKVFLPALTDSKYSKTKDTATCSKKGAVGYTIVISGEMFNFTVETPATGEHTYKDGVCTGCGAKNPTYVPHDHTYVNKSDSEGHWTECSCGDKTQKVPHSYVGGVCSCGAKDPAAHQHTYADKHDGEGHWTECSCGDKTQKVPHSYVNGVCSCGAKEPASEHQHSYAATGVKDEYGHEMACSCGDKINELHSLQYHHAYTGYHIAFCLVCGYEGEPERHHFVDGACACGETSDSAELTFILSNDKTYYICNGGTVSEAELIIPSEYNGKPVKAIGGSAFYGCTDITSVTLPDGIISIGEAAFDGCANLKYNEYGNALYLGNDNNPYLVLAKAKNNAITSCAMHADTKVIADFAFGNECKSIKSITIGSNVAYIGEKAFYGCWELTNINIPANVVSIGKGFVGVCYKLSALTVDAGNAKFYSKNNCIIEKQTKTLVAGCKGSVIPDDGSVTKIGDNAFQDCWGLKSIVIPDGVTYIGDYAFARCPELVSLTLPSSVTSVGMQAFFYCPKLTAITFKGTKAQWDAVTKRYGWDQNQGNGKDGNLTVTCAG